MHNTTRLVRTLTASLVALSALAACSKGGSTTQPGVSAQSASAAAQTAAASSDRETVANPCDHAIAAADVAGIITAPVTRKSGADAETCVYRARSGADISISVARGDTAKGAWSFAKTYGGRMVPIAGVGDEALWGHEGTVLIARKGDLSCRVDVLDIGNADAMVDITKARDEALARKLGALCTKVFATQ